MNRYIALLEDRQRAAAAAPGAHRPLRCHFFNTFFFSTLTARVPGTPSRGVNYAAVQRWTAKVNPLQAANLLLVPVNTSNQHWSLIVVALRSQRIVHLDR